MTNRSNVFRRRTPSLRLSVGIYASTFMLAFAAGSWIASRQFSILPAIFAGAIAATFSMLGAWSRESFVEGLVIALIVTAIVIVAPPWLWLVLIVKPVFIGVAIGKLVGGIEKDFLESQAD